MARIYGLNGLIRGRQGNNVFAIQNGTQVLKVYNPSVANPRTEPQQLQRAKFALAGKLSAATPNDAVIGLVGSSKRSRRAKYVSNIVRAAVANVVSGSYHARIEFSDFVFSEGSLGRYSSSFTITARYFDPPDTSIDLNIPAMSLASTAPAGYGEMVVCGIFDGDGSPLDKIKVITRSTESGQHVYFRQNVVQGFVAVAWVVPFLLVSENAALVTGNLGVVDAHNAVEVSSNPVTAVSSAEFGQSMFNNFVWVPAPAQSNLLDGASGTTEQPSSERKKK